MSRRMPEGWSDLNDGQEQGTKHNKVGRMCCGVAESEMSASIPYVVTEGGILALAKSD